MAIASTTRRGRSEAPHSADHTLEFFQKRIEVDKEMLLILIECSPQLILYVMLCGVCVDLHGT